MTVTGGWHQWRTRTPWPNIWELLYNVELITKRCFAVVLLTHAACSYFIFRCSTLLSFYFKHMSPAPRLCLRLGWKAKFVIFFCHMVHLQWADESVMERQSDLNCLSQKGITPYQSVPVDICCHFNLFPLFISVLKYSCNDVINGLFSGWIWQMSTFYGCSIIPEWVCLFLGMGDHSRPYISVTNVQTLKWIWTTLLFLSSKNIDHIDIIVRVMRTFISWGL